MSKSLLDLADSLEKKAKAIEKASSKSAVNCALSIVGSLVYSTPVDSSQALSNWIVTIGTPYDGKIGPLYPGKKGSTYKASAAEALADAKKVLQNHKSGQVIYITNNQPYIRRLNSGYSAQQPAGFVERAVLIGRKQIKFKIEGSLK